MILLPEQKTLIITPPHTGSGNLIKAFKNHVYGPNPDGNIDHHYGAIHNDHLGWRKILIVRRPFERFVGLYHHCREELKLEDLYWNQYCINVFSGKHNWFYSWSITKIMRHYIPSFNPKDFEIWPMENFPKMPEGIECNIEPRQNYYDYSKHENNKELIEMFWKEDLELYE